MTRNTVDLGGGDADSGSDLRADVGFGEPTV